MLHRNQSDHQRHRAAGPRGHRIIGSLLDVRRDRIRFITNAAREFGDLVEFRMGPRRLYLISHPDYARHILVRNHANYRKGLGLAEARPLFGGGLLTSEGREWSADRARLQAAFQAERLPDYGDQIVAATARVLDRWSRYARAGTRFDIHPEMARLTLDVTCQALLGVELNGRGDALIANMSRVSRWAMKQMTALIRIPMSIPTPGNLEMRRALGELDSYVAERIRDFRPTGRQTILDLLMPDGGQSLKGNSAQSVRDHILTFLLAGHETTAATLTWTWYLLSRHRQVENRLVEELQGVLGDRPPQYADLRELPYLRAVIQEVLRLYPPVWMIARKAIAPDRIGPVAIPAGADLLASVYTIHRHPDFWPDPERFDPDRFAADRPRPSAGNAYLAFGAGPRTCIGANLGLVEAMLVMASLLPKFRVRLLNEQAVRPEAMLTLCPAGGLPGRVTSRSRHTADSRSNSLASHPEARR